MAMQTDYIWAIDIIEKYNTHLFSQAITNRHLNSF